jgi:hypothetical protein
MQVRQILIVVAALGVGTVARAESIVPCNFVDDFCVEPPGPEAHVESPAPESGRRAARPMIPANFVDDVGVVEDGPASGAATTVAVPTAVPSEPGRGVGPLSERP